MGVDARHQPRDPWSQNIGAADKVAEVMSRWLGSIDFGEIV
jgi:hypothetical protein